MCTESETRSTDRSAFGRSCTWLFLAVLAVFILSPVVTNGDGYLSVPTAISVVHDGDLNLDEYDNVPRVQGHYANGHVAGHRMSEFPWIASVFAIPAVVAWDVGHFVGIGPGADAAVRADESGALAFSTAALIAAVSVLAVTVLAHDRLRGHARTRRRLAVTVGAVFALGTSVWSIASRGLWQHGPSVLFVTVALIATGRIDDPLASDPRRRIRYAAAAGAAAALAVAIRPTNAILLGLIALWIAWRRTRTLPAFALGTIAVLGPWTLVTALSYHRLLQAYGSASRLSIHRAYGEALAANLVSPARGLLIFSPIVLLAIPGTILAFRRPGGPDALEWISLIVLPVHWLVISAYGENWIGGDSYGPRFFTDVLPFIIILSIPAVQALAAMAPGATKRVVIVAVVIGIGWSVFTHAQGAVLRAAQCWSVDPVSAFANHERIWSWSDPQFLRGIDRLLTRSVHDAVFQECRASLENRLPRAVP